jgi:cephalosporin-C deacetylase
MDFREYWQETLAELVRYPARPELQTIPLRSTAFATLYAVRLTGVGPYRLFGYLSIPTGAGPFPAIYYAPKYQSVLEIIPQGTANLQRSRYITFSLAGRGQRNADTPYAAMFPGLLTDGIDDAAAYVFRSVVADSVRGLEFLLTRRELDPARVVVVGNDLALITGALTSGATHVMTAPALFYRTVELAPKTQAYPLEEVNDYLRRGTEQFARRAGAEAARRWAARPHHGARIRAVDLPGRSLRRAVDRRSVRDRRRAQHPPGALAGLDPAALTLAAAPA